MKNATFFLSRRAGTGFAAIMLAALLQFPAQAQISFNNDDAGNKADSRKVRREAARYKADAVKESHLNMDKYTYKRGGFGKSANEELQYDEIYYGPNPVKAEKKFFKKKR